MSNCITELVNNITTENCDDKAKVGIETAVIINLSHIDPTQTIWANSEVTSFSLKSGTSGLKMDSYRDMNAYNTALTPTTSDALGGFTHSLTGSLIGGSSLENAQTSKQLADGNFVVVVQTTYGKNTANQYKVFGLENGLRALEINHSSNESDSRITFNLSTADTAKENDAYLILNNGTVAEMEAEFASLFANV